MGHDAQADADAAAVRSHRITSDLQSRLQTATNANGKTKTDIEKKMGKRERGEGGDDPKTRSDFPLCLVKFTFHNYRALKSKLRGGKG